ncbi:hypothetical protein J437_LFUL000167 [Ladona fulva]|uniref:URB1 N-terminal domain-containing protein n=1 Tax=Ladona fulva TaxID=123851 RepID=A0A8K0KD06_LADFU|nr:hypothetical protein J437_LFUL000167 [Ladona fulva]
MFQVDPVSKKQVEEATYQLLKVLCASRKFGVIFYDPSYGSSGRNYNQLVQKVLEILEKPWEKDVVAKLLCDIFSACPDLIHLTVSRMGPFVEPRMSPKWIQAVDFIIQIIDGIDPKNILSKAGSLTVAQLITIFEQVVTPKSILRIIFGSTFSEAKQELDLTALKNSQICIRHSAVALLSSITNAAGRFHDYNGLEEYFGSTVVADQFRQQLLDHLFMVLPNVTDVLHAWQLTVDENKNGIVRENSDLNQSLSDLPHITAADHLRQVLKLMLAYVRCWPPHEVTTEDNNFSSAWGLLKSPNFLRDAQSFRDLEPMALELLSSCGTFSISSNQGPLNRDIFKRLLCLFAKEEEESRLLTWRRLLLSTLLKSGFFDGNEVEACLWIHSFQLCCFNEDPLDEKKVDSLAEFMVSSFCNLMHFSEKYLHLISNAFAATSSLEKCHDKNSTRSLLIDLMENDMESDNDTNTTNEILIYSQRSIPTISPLLPAALCEMKNYEKGSQDFDVISYFLQYIILNIFHGQDSFEPLLYILENDLSSYSPSKSLKKYLKGWSSKKLHCVDEIISGDHPLCLCSKELISKSKASNDALCKIKDSLQTVSIFQLITFHLASLAKQNILDEASFATGKKTLLSLFENPYLSVKEENVLYHKSTGKVVDVYELCLQSALNNSILLKLFNPLGGETESRRLVTSLINHILSLANLLLKDKDLIGNLTLPFKKKFLQDVTTSLEEISECKELLVNWDEDSMFLFLSHFTLSSDEILALLDKFASIPPVTLIRPSDRRLSGPGFLLIKLFEELCKRRKLGLQTFIKSSSFEPVAKFLYTLEEMSEQAVVDNSCNGLSVLEDCILQVLQIFPHLIDEIDTRLLNIFISSRYHRKTADALGQFLICESENFRAFFLELCNVNHNIFSANSGRILEYLESMIKNGKLDIPENVLVKIYEEYKESLKDVLKKYSEVPSWLKNNLELFKMIVERTLDEEKCYKLWTLAKKKATAFINGEHSFFEIVHSLLKKAEKKCAIPEESPHFSFFKLTLEGFTNVLKAVLNDSSNEEMAVDLLFFSELIGNVLDGVVEKDEKYTESKKCPNSSWNMLQKDKIWRELTQLSLKIGIGQNNGPLIRCFRKICSRVIGKNDSEAVLLFKMCIMHSKFLDIMLENRSSKGEILEFLLMLLEKYPNNSYTSLVPVLLSSYGASLGKTDLVTLKLLKLIDHDELSFNQFSPYLWGEMAASFYSLKSQVSSAAFSAFSILRQPKADQVLELIDLSRSELTICNFPIYRGFLAEESFDFSSEELLVYDPCFYLPLFSHILAPENPVKVYKFTQTGALALTVAALGSHNNYIRAAAMHVLARFYSHLETGR